MWNNNFTLRDLLMDTRMRGVFPQFGQKQPVMQVYSFAEQTRQIKDYLCGLLRATQTVDGDLTVRENYREVLARVNAAKENIEKLFNSMPSISANLSRNTRVFMPFATKEQIQSLSDLGGKIAALDALVENIQYNPDYVNRSHARQTAAFESEQFKWQTKVGYRKGDY